MAYNYSTLDPRNIPVAQEANSQVLGPNTLGIEVTIPALAAQCGLGNVDPQHFGENADLSAIEVACGMELPPDGAMLVTVRADLDAVGAMVMVNLRRNGDLPALIFESGSVRREDGEGLLSVTDVVDRIYLIAQSDKFARGGWPGVQSLPSRDNLWPRKTAGASDSRDLAAIAAAVSDFKLSMAERVRLMGVWLTTGEEPASYRAQVEKERMDMIQALENGTIKVSTDGRIAVVESTHRAVMTVGYALAPVVVALNPAFRLQGGEPHRKFTVAQFTLGFVDMKTATAELNNLEAGWGGSPTIAGSPQGVGSALTTDQVVEVMNRHFLAK